MKTSVLIIAHNEEAHIEKCIASILNQTQKVDEVVLIVHNSTDETFTRAQRFPIRVVPFIGEKGITHARIEGLQHVTGDMILCIDGDSYAAPDWAESLVGLLEKGNILVGSWVRFTGNTLSRITNLWNKYWCVGRHKVERKIWGASFAFYGKDKEKVIAVFTRSFELSRQLKLSRNPDDYWLALYMKTHGRLAVTNKTWVLNNTKEGTSIDAQKRLRENKHNGNVMEAFVASGGDIL